MKPVSQDLVIRLATNYRQPVSLARSRWRLAKSKATKDGYTDYQRALEIFHDIRNTPLSPKKKADSALNIERRRARLRELTRSAIPVPRRSSPAGK